MPRTIPLDAQRLAVKLGVGPLVDRKPCHGKANGCICSRCARPTRLNVVTMGAPREEVSTEPHVGGYLCQCADCLAELDEILARGPRPDSLAA